MSEAVTGAGLEEGLQSVDVGDEVHVAMNNYEWSSPLEVVDADEPVEWDVPLGEDWLTRSLIIEGGYGSEYAIEIDADSDDVLPREVYRYEDGELGDKRGRLTRFEPVAPENTDNETEGSSDDEDDEIEAVEVDDPSGGDQDEDDSEDVELPAGVTESDVHAAVDDHEYLDAVADELEIREARARSVVHGIGRYSEIREASSYRGGVSREH